MVRIFDTLVIIIEIVTVSIFITIANARDVLQTAELSMEMTVRALEAVCWYDYYKIILAPASFANNCRRAECIKNQTLEAWNDEPEKIVPKFATQIHNSLVTSRLSIPSEYVTSCHKLSLNLTAKPLTDESEALNDGGKPYELKAFVYCLMMTLRNKYGDAAITAVREEFGSGRKSWMETLIDRQNEHRARHGVEPFELDPELSESAQKWATKLAAYCGVRFSHYRARLYNGVATGENVFSTAGCSKQKEDSYYTAYTTANKWYEKIKHYPFGENITEDKVLYLGKYGSATATIWKDSVRAGYGYAYNRDCVSESGSSTGTAFFVARYYPPGNIRDEKSYMENVLPPIE